MNSVRSGLKTGLLGISLAEIAASFGMRRLRASLRAMRPRDRANWLQDAASTVLRRIGIAVVAQGDPPLDGLVVSNHLSYLDVLAYASLMPCVFVAKQEVHAWPVFGQFATMAGTIFVDRKRHAVNGGAAMVEEALRAGVPVVLFPEGTSTDGRAVLPFHSGFFEPAIRTNAAVTAAAIGYTSSTAEEASLAYYANDIFGTHLARTLGQGNVEARVIFSAKQSRYASRKKAARGTQREVESLRTAIAGPRAENQPLQDGFFRLTRAG
jgi:lyso-ornithine lipid O-acyltransferase